MRELIDRDAALACFTDYIDKHGDIYPAADCPEYRAIEALPAVPGTEWIPCSDQLPETDDKVLCCTLTKKGIPNIIVGYYLAGADRWVSGMNGNVVAWMPLPEPYKEGKHETD